MLEKGHGESVLSKTRTYEWYKAFTGGRGIVIHIPRSRRSSTSSTHENIEKVKEIVLDNRHSSSIEVARDLNIFHEYVRLILVGIFGMRRVSVRFVPKELNLLQKQYHEWHPGSHFRSHIHGTNYNWWRDMGLRVWQTGQQLSEWETKDEPKPRKPRQSHPKGKVMLIVFFDIPTWFGASRIRSRGHQSTTIFSRSGPVWLLSVSETEIAALGYPFGSTEVIKQNYKIKIESFSKTEKDAGICVLHQMEPTLKATKWMLLNKWKLCLLFKNSRYFFHFFKFLMKYWWIDWKRLVKCYLIFHISK